MKHALDKKIVPITPPGVIKDDAAFDTTPIDTAGFSHMSVYVMLGATDIQMAALKLQSSDTNSNYEDVAGLNFATLPATLPSATDDNKVFAIHVDLRGKKRWWDLVATAGNGAAGTYMAAWAELSNPQISPSDAAGRGLAQEIFG